MRIIISPAKKMRQDMENLSWQALPVLLDKTELLLARMQQMTYSELKTLWKCNDAIAALNVERLRDMRLREALTPALLAYEGIQYRYMAPGFFVPDELAYICQHLRILSGFYGLLRPMDGVRPYRLEMQAKLSVGNASDLYAFWGKNLAEKLQEETDCLVDLASREYSLAVTRHLEPGMRRISCVFGEEHQGRVIEKGTMCKMARGEMVRFMAENDIRQPEAMKGFDRLYYRFSPAHSTEERYVFLLDQERAAIRQG